MSIERIKDLISKIENGLNAESELTDKVYQGFGKDNMWIIKREI